MQVDVISHSHWQAWPWRFYFQGCFCAALNNIPCMAADREMRGGFVVFFFPLPSRCQLCRKNRFGPSESWPGQAGSTDITAGLLEHRLAAVSVAAWLWYGQHPGVSTQQLGVGCWVAHIQHLSAPCCAREPEGRTGQTRRMAFPGCCCNRALQVETSDVRLGGTWDF